MTEKVALLDSINPAAKNYFESNGLEVVEFGKSIQPADLATLVSDVRLLGVRSGPEIPANVIEASVDLEAIGCFCVGTNHIDKTAADHQGIAIFNALHENTRSVAEYVVATTFGLLKRIPEHSRAMHDGIWTKTDERSYEVRGKSLGIVGYGAIGSQVSVLAEAIGMDVLYFDPAPKMPSHGRAKRVDTLEEILSLADVVTLHVPGGANTKGMINARAISVMKPGSYLINASRGDVVDYEAINAAIGDGRLGGVAADVFEGEPTRQGADFDHVLRGLGSAILTPHIAGSTIEAQVDIGDKIAAKLFSYLATGNSVGAVNLPELSPSNLQPGQSRIVHIHNNVAGAMAGLNGVVAEAGLNIINTIQRAQGDLGYVVLDVEGVILPEVTVAIRSMKTTRKVRVIN